MHKHPPRWKYLRTAVVAGGLALGLTVLGAGPAIAAPTGGTVTVTATPQATVGAPVDVTVTLQSVSDAYAYGVTLAYDPALLAYTAGSVTGPAGGFDTVSQGTGSVTLLHTRLGTSPTLSGNLTATAQFSTIGSGSGSVTVSSVSLVDASGSTTPVSSAATAPVVVTAVVVPTPPPTATPTPTASPQPSSSATPVPAPGASSATADTAANSGFLASTGSNVVLLIILAVFAAAAVLAGMLVVARRTARTR